MSRDRLTRESFTHEQAADLVAHVVRERERWGKHYTGDDIGIDIILDCLIFMSQEGTEDVRELRESIKQKNLQLGAAQARETKLRADLKKAKGETSDQD